MTTETWTYDKNGFIDDYTINPENSKETHVRTFAGKSMVALSMAQLRADGMAKDCFCYLTVDECESLIIVLKEHLESIAHR